MDWVILRSWDFFIAKVCDDRKWFLTPCPNKMMSRTIWVCVNTLLTPIIEAKELNWKANLFLNIKSEGFCNDYVTF